jgi:hypothetical protein
MVRGCEVELDPGRFLDLLVGVELGAVIRRDGGDTPGLTLDELYAARDRIGCAVPRELAWNAPRSWDRAKC